MLAAIAPSISAGSERPPSDPSEWQAFAFFAHQSHQARQRDRKTKHVPHSRNAITFVSFDGPSVHRMERGAFRSHFHDVGVHRRWCRPRRFWRLPSALIQQPSKNLDRWSVRKFFRPSWPTLAIGRMPHAGNFNRKLGTTTILSAPRTEPGKTRGWDPPPG